MKFLGFEGGTIREGMMGEAYEWLATNEEELRSTAPEGTEYLGVYAPVFTSDKNPGDVYFVLRPGLLWSTRPTSCFLRFSLR